MGDKLGAFEIVFEGEDEPGGDEGGEGGRGEQDEGTEMLVDEVGGDVGPAAVFEHAEEIFVVGWIALCAGNPGAAVTAGYDDSEVERGREGAEDHLAERCYLALKGVPVNWPIFLHVASST